MTDAAKAPPIPLLALAKPRDLSLPMKVAARPRPSYSRARPALMICINVRKPEEGSSCGPRGGSEILESMTAATACERIDAEIVAVRCLGTCDRGPTIRLSPNNSWFYGAHVADVPALLAHLRTAAEEYAALPASPNEQEKGRHP